MKPVLSISLLCSGRKETTRKCLDSLKPIMEQIESELIIVDTGCDDLTRALLSEYTDHIVPFTWCDDFSKARNAGLKEAKGEWFLYIDDDEWFGDVQELIAFFKTGEYRKYGVACYIQRNYTDYSGNVYLDMWASRMIKIRKDTRFVDRIHEYLMPVYGENKLINSWVDHYGYVYDNLEEKKKHDERNVVLLESMVKENPGHLRARAHLAQEYYGIPDCTKMAELCKESVEMLRKKKSDAILNSYRQTFYLGTMLALLSLHQFEEAEEFFAEAVRDKRNDNLGRAGLCQFGAEVYYQKKDYDACEKCCQEYVKVYNAEGGKINEVPASPIFTQNLFFVGGRNNVYCLYMWSRLAQDDTEALKEYFWKLGWEEENFSIHEQLIPCIIDAMVRMPFEEDFVPIAQKLAEDKRVVESAVAEIKKKTQKNNEKALYALAKIFGQVKTDHYYIWYLKLFYAAKEQGKEAVEEAYRWIFKKIADVLSSDDAFFAIADEYEIEMDDIIACAPFDQWKNGVDTFCERNPMNVVWKKKEFMERHCHEGNVRYEYFMMKVSEAEAVITPEYKNYNAVRKQMKNFSERSMAFYAKFFRQEAFEGEMEMLPLPGRVAVHLKHALQAEESGDIASFREALTKAIGIFGPIDEGLQYFGKLYAAQREAQLEESRRAGDEMKSLARQVKRQLYRFIDQGDKKTAYGIWQQLHALTPDDPELVTLEKMCKE